MNKMTEYPVRSICDLRDMMRSSVKLDPEKPAFLVKRNNEYVPISYRKFQNDIECLGSLLMDMGYGGKTVAVIGENSYHWILTYMAVVCGVGVIVPLDRELAASEIRNLMAESGATVILHSEHFSAKVAEATSELDSIECISFERIPQLILKGKALLESGFVDYVHAEIDREGLTALLFTSGTTGKPKGVMLSHKNLVSVLMGSASLVEIRPQDIFMSILPIHHTYECTCTYLMGLYRGSTIAICEGLRHLMKNINEANATVLLAVPLIYENMHRTIWATAKKTGQVAKLTQGLKISRVALRFGVDTRKILFKKVHESFGKSLRLLVCGGANLDPEVSKGMTELGFLLVQGYGLTETAPISALMPDGWVKHDAVGVAIKGCEIAIDNPNEEGVGEIKIKGDHVMCGYYKNPAETERVLQNGWFYSGDLGRLDDDGFLHINGRRKNVIIAKNGKNVYPEELEAMLGRDELVAECLVYGEQGQEDVVICAEIRVDETLAAKCEDREQAIAKVVEQLNKELPIYKKIRKYSIRDEEFDKTTSMKIKRPSV